MHSTTIDTTANSTLTDRATRLRDAQNVAAEAAKARTLKRAADLTTAAIDLAIDNPEEEWAFPILAQADYLGRNVAAAIKGYLIKPSREVKAIVAAAERPADGSTARDVVNAINLGRASDAVDIARAKGADRFVARSAAAIHAVNAAGESPEDKAIAGLNRAYMRECDKGADHRATIGRARSMIARGLASAEDFDFPIA